MGPDTQLTHKPSRQFPSSVSLGWPNTNVRSLILLQVWWHNVRENSFTSAFSFYSIPQDSPYKQITLASDGHTCLSPPRNPVSCRETDSWPKQTSICILFLWTPSEGIWRESTSPAVTDGQEEWQNQVHLLIFLTPAPNDSTFMPTYETLLDLCCF